MLNHLHDSGLPNVTRFWPVSYTHLDVYKRQAVRAIIGGTVTDYLPGSEYAWKVFVLHADAGIRLVVFQQYVVAVSYTHLDVYKRQLYFERIASVAF